MCQVNPNINLAEHKAPPGTKAVIAFAYYHQRIAKHQIELPDGLNGNIITARCWDPCGITVMSVDDGNVALFSAMKGTWDKEVVYDRFDRRLLRNVRNYSHQLGVIADKLRIFLRIGYELSEVWEWYYADGQLSLDDLMPNYPSYLPSFDEFLCDLGGLLEDGG